METGAKGRSKRGARILAHAGIVWEFSSGQPREPMPGVRRRGPIVHDGPRSQAPITSEPPSAKLRALIMRKNPRLSHSRGVERVARSIRASSEQMPPKPLTPWMKGAPS